MMKHTTVINRSSPARQLSARKRQRGVGLVEVMVALVLVAILFNGLMELLLNSRAAYSATEQITRLNENGRTAVDLLVTGLRRAGYRGGNSDISTIVGTLPPVTPAATCADDDDSWGRMIARGVYGINDANTNYECIPSAADADPDDAFYLRGDVLTLRYASPWQVETADFEDDRIYLRSSLFEGKMFLGQDTADSGNTVNDSPQRQHQLLAYSYYISETGRSCNGNAIPGLFREALNEDNEPEAEELISGVEDLQFRYNIGGRYVDANLVTDWADVTAVKLWVLARSECSERSHTDTRTYLLGDQVYAPGDNFRRQLYSTVVAMRNQ